MAAKNNSVAKTYIKNVGKSFGYAALDVFEHYNPTLSNLYKSSKEAVTEAKKSIQEAKMKQNVVENTTPGGGFDYILDDLTSGKWYNKERENEDKAYLSKIEKEDWGDETSTGEAVAESAIEIMKQNSSSTNKISDSIYGISENISESIGYASAKSAEYIVKSQSKATKALYGMTSVGFNRVTNVLLNINHSIDTVAGLGESLTAHMKNATTFYITATEKLTNIDSNIAKLVKMQEAANKAPNGINRKNTKGIENLLNADGEIDMVSYVKMVKDNLEQYKSLYETISDKNKVSWFSGKGGTMLSSGLVQLVDSIIPKFTKDAMENLNKTIKDSIVAGLNRGSMKASKSSNPIVNLLGDLFLPKDGYKDKIDTKNYEKGQVAWDGIARKSLVEVIPTYLAKIYAALGGEERYYDFEAGKFVKLESIKNNFEYDKRIAAVKAGGNMRTDILSDIRKNSPEADRARLENEVESFFLQAFVDGYDFTEIANMVNDPAYRKKYGITRESAKYIIDYIGSKDVKKARNSAKFISSVYTGRNEFGNTMRRKEFAGNSSLTYLNNGASDTSFTAMKDKYKKDQSYYLRGIYTLVGNIYGNIAVSGGNNVRKVIVDPDKSPKANSTHFNPDTGRFYTKVPGSSKESKPNTPYNVLSNKPDKNGITIEDRAKYMGMTDAQIIEAKKRDKIIKQIKEGPFMGNQLVPIGPTDSNGKGKVKRGFRSALSKAKDIYEAPFAALTDMINNFTVNINNMFWGNDNKKGVIDKVSDYIDSLWTKIFGDEEKGIAGMGMAQAMEHEWQNIKTKAKQKATNFFGNIGARDKAVKDKAMAEAVYNQVTGNTEVPGHAGGREITKTGLIAVSEGELVIPSEFNPYYNKPTNKLQQRSKEQSVINKFYGAFADGGTVGGNAFENGKFVEEVDVNGNKVYKFVKEDGTVIKLKNRSEYARRIAQYKIKQAAKEIDENTGASTIAKDGVNLLGAGVWEFIKASLFGDEKQQEDDKKKVFENLTDVFKEMGDSKGAMGIGAITGAGVSLLTGALVGPLAGAAIGAGAGLIAKSEKVQKALFGEPDENGNYDKPIGNFVMKKLPTIATYTGIGTAAGALLGSPVIGAFLGAGIGFATKSDAVKDYLFGKVGEDGNRSGGLITDELKDKLKKAAPNMAAGALAGLLLGPFGVVGNIMVGSAVGYLSTGEKFREYFFGNGKDDKGLAGIIHNKIVKGLDDLLHNSSNALKGWMKKMGAKINNKITGYIDKAKNAYNNGAARGIQKLVGFTASVPGAAIKKAANITGDAVQGLANRRRAKNLAKGYNVWNAEEKRNATAEERLAMRSKDDISTAANIDRIIAGADAEQLNEIYQILEDVKDPTRKFNTTKNKATTSLYSSLYDLDVDRKLAKRIVENAGGENGVTRLEELLNGSGYDDEKKEKIKKAFNIADQEITKAKDTKTATKGNIALLKDKYGINVEGKDNLDITNYMDLIDYDKKIRFSDLEADLNKKTEQYQGSVVSLLSDMANNSNYFKEYIQGKRTAEGRYAGEIDEEGKSKFFKYDEEGNKVEVKASEAIANYGNQRDLIEKFNDTKHLVADTTVKVVDTVAEPIKNTVTDVFNVVKDEVVEPMVTTVKEISATVKDLYRIGIKGYNEENPEINTDEYYGPTSNIDIINTGQRLKTRAGYLFNRFKRGYSDVKNAMSNSGSGSGLKARQRIVGLADGGDGRNSFLDLLASKVIEKLNYTDDIASRKLKLFNKDDEEDQKVETDMFGNIHQYTKNNQGEWTEVDNDSDTKKSRSIIDKFTESINSVPLLGKAIGGLGAAFGLFKDSLIGSEEKPGLLSKLFGKLVGEDGFLSGLFGLFTGKTSFSKLLSGVSLSSVMSNIVAPALLLGGFSGMFDGLANKVTNGAYGKGDEVTATDKNTGETIYQQKDENGNEYWTDKNGNKIENPDVTKIDHKQTSPATLSDKLKYNTTRGILTGKAFVAGKVLGKTGIGKKIANTNIAKSTAKFVKDGADDLAVAALQGSIGEALTKAATKLAPILSKFGISPDTTTAMFAKLTEKIGTKLGSSGVKSALKTAADFVVFARIAFAVIDFTTGYQDARTTLGIIDEPTFGQKILSGVIRVVKNLIPVVGTLIPDSLIVDVVCDFIAPVLGIELEELKAQRQKAKDKVKEYNSTNGTNIGSVAEYNKSVDGDYTWTEKLGRGAKNIVSNVKNTFKKSKAQEVVADASGSGSGFVSQYDPRYQKYNVSGQNFAAKGCGPAVAAMAARSLGKNVSVSDAVNGSVGYQNPNGVSMDYFQNMLGSKGINTRYISGGSSNELYNSIANGDKVVLLGRDPMNTSKELSPFGPNNHYVLATGLDRSGNIIVNDPENRGPKAYSPSILNSAKYGIAGSNSGLKTLPRRTKIHKYFSGGNSMYDTEVARQVWAFFTSKGYSKTATAAIMGNMYGESGMNPSSIQGGGRGPAAGICQWENYNTKSGRWASLNELATSNGRDWTDLDIQLRFVDSELNSKDIDNRMQGKGNSAGNLTKAGLATNKAMPFAQWKTSCTDLDVATRLFEAAFERAGKPAMKKRIDAAIAYYNLYSGSNYTYSASDVSYTATSTSVANSTGDDTGSTDTNSTESNGLFKNPLSILSDLSTVFSNAFMGLTKSKGETEAENTETNSSSSSSDSSNGFSQDSVVSDAAVGDGNQKQKNLVKALLEKQGTLKYDMKGARNPDKGSADCSSTVNWAYKKITGTDIGNDTASILNNKNTEVVDLASNMDPNNGGKQSSGPNVSKLMPGDLLLYSRPDSGYSAGRKYRVGHVEMYVGNGNRIGHGGPGLGPNVTPITKDANRYIEAKRLKGITDGDSGQNVASMKADRANMSAAGSGLIPMSYQDIANASGGSSGILMNARIDSRNNIVRSNKAVALTPRGFSGGASDMTEATRTMLTNISNTTKSNSKGISPEVVTRLIESITTILNRIADNTAPVSQIYQALVAYMQSGGDSGVKDNVVIKKDNSNNRKQPAIDQEVDSSISTLVDVLAELAKG